MKTGLLWVLAASTALLLGGAAVAAHPGHTHKILGTIATLQQQRIEVLDKSGEKSTFAITKETKILVGEKKGTIKDLKLGARVVVEGEEEEEEDGKASALVIRVGAQTAK